MTTPLSLLAKIMYKSLTCLETTQLNCKTHFIGVVVIILKSPNQSKLHSIITQHLHGAFGQNQRVPDFNLRSYALSMRQMQILPKNFMYHS